MAIITTLQPRLDLYQAQSPVMTPKLQEAIKLLQLSNLELIDYLEKELEKNPFLEYEDSDEDLIELARRNGFSIQLQDLREDQDASRIGTWFASSRINSRRL